MTTSPRVLIYVTPHGFGHAARQAAIVGHWLQNKMAGAVAFASGPRQLAFLASQFPNGSVTFFETPAEPGIPLTDNYEPDHALLQSKLGDWLDTWGDWNESQTATATAFKPDFIVSDCSPQPFLLAARLRIPPIFTGNFTWDEIYSPLAEQQFEIDFIRYAYSKAARAVWLAGCGNGHEPRAGFFSRPVNTARVNEIRESVGNRPIVLVTLGQATANIMPFRVEIPGMVVMATSNTRVLGGDTHLIPVDTADTQNYVAAADVVVTKVGWSTIAEAVNNRRPLVLLWRRDLSEDQHILACLERRGIAVGLPIFDVRKGLSDAVSKARSLASNYTDSDPWWNNDLPKAAGMMLEE